MDKEQIQRLLDISAQHGVEVPKEIVKEWEKLTSEQLSKILELALYFAEKDDIKMKTIKCRVCKIPMQFRVAPSVNARCLHCTQCGWLHEWRDQGAAIDVQLRIAGLRDDEWAALGYPEPREVSCECPRHQAYSESAK